MEDDGRIVEGMNYLFSHPFLEIEILGLYSCLLLFFICFLVTCIFSLCRLRLGFRSIQQDVKWWWVRF